MKLLKIAWWTDEFIKLFFKNKKMDKYEDMTLREKQSVFLKNVAKLILWAFDNGYELTGGELLRTNEQQEIYLKEGKSKTINSQHLKKLAIDLNLFIDGKYQYDNEAYKPLAEYWKSLHPDNVAGYDWGWDSQHFEMK